jgi:hypothetical protein
MPLDPIDIVQADLGASRSSRTISEIAKSTRLPRDVVQAAIRELAARGRLWRDVREQDSKLVTTWFVIPAPAARPPRLADELAVLEVAA